MPADPIPTTPHRSMQPVMVVHGPFIFDTGDAAWLCSLLSPRRCLVAGVMGRTAAEESGLPVTCCGEVPSRVIGKIRGPAFLANRGKTPGSGRAFGKIIAAKLAAAGIPLVHVECADRSVYVWNGPPTPLAEWLAASTGFTLRLARSGPLPSGSTRTIHGCLPGEPVFVNGIVIGTATSDPVVIACRDGRIEGESGIAIKEHGIEKLVQKGPVDLANAWCKSGPVRNALPKGGHPPRSSGRIAVIDHAGCECYDRIGPETCGVLAIGDDTTMVCGHICYHMGIPIFGVVDGDADGIVETRYPPGSVVVKVRRGRDDDVGRWLAERIPADDIEWNAAVVGMLADLGEIADIVVNVPREEDIESRAPEKQ